MDYNLIKILSERKAVYRDEDGNIFLIDWETLKRRKLETVPDGQSIDYKDFFETPTSEECKQIVRAEMRNILTKKKSLYSLRCRVLSHFMKFRIPERLEEVNPLAGSPRMFGIITHPDGGTTSCVVGEPKYNMIVYYEIILTRRPKFLALTHDGMKNLFDALSEFLNFYGDDLFADYELRNDSPIPEWNAAVEAKWKKDEEDNRKAEIELKHEEVEAKKMIEKTASELGLDVHIVDDRGIWEVIIEADGETTRRHMAPNIRDAKDICNRMKWMARDLAKRRKEVERIKRNEIPLVQIGDFKIYFRDIQNGRLHVPSNVVGHVIGRGGEMIKSISKVYGRRVRIIPDLPPIDTGRKTKIRRYIWKKITLEFM